MLYTSRSFTTSYPMEEADVVVLGIPFDSTAYSEGNQRYGPTTIRETLKYRTTYQEDLDINPMKELKIHDSGDIEVVPGDYKATEERIKETVERIREVNQEALLVFLGGEHTVSLGTVKSTEPKTMVQLDAHKDMEKNLNGNRYTHNTWVNHLPEEKEIVQIGTREYTEEENKIHTPGKEKLEKIEEPIYLSIDMDFMDPVFAPDVGYPEPNGKTPAQADEILSQVFKKKVTGMDICEVASKELNNRTSYLAGWLILRSLSHYTKNI